MIKMSGIFHAKTQPTYSVRFWVAPDCTGQSSEIPYYIFMNKVL